jgi:hypothetical protein
MLKIRASQLGLIMTEPKLKTEVLSVGAKTYIKKLAREFVYNFEEDISSKYTDKGLIVEDAAIALYNRVFFTDYKKNEERKTNDWITGECDIYTGKKIIDIKSSWSLATFPVLSEDGIDKQYEWQGRAYMMLWNCDYFENAYCMVSTPEELLRYDQEDLHYVDNIDESLRVTITPYERDLKLEEQIIIKCEAAQNYFNEVLERIAQDHNH